MNIADKLQTIAENEQKVHKAGQLKTLQDSEYMNAKVSGTAIAVNDVSPIEHSVGCKLTSDTITDFSGIEVSRYGKNLLPISYVLSGTTINGVTVTVNEDMSITCNGTATDNVAINITPNHSFRLPIGQYTLSGCPDTGSSSIRQLVSVIKNAGTLWSVIDFGKGSTFNLTTNDYDYLRPMVYIATGNVVSNLTFKPMLQLGTGVDMTYEPPIIETYTPNADGTVEGVTSISPNMTLLTNNNGVVINANYLRDIDTYINNLKTNVALTGGE